jgi:hypothetical protein
MQFILRVFLSSALLLAASGCRKSEGGEGSVASSTTTANPTAERARLVALLKSQAVERAKRDATCKKVMQHALVDKAIFIIAGIGNCVAAIQAKNAPQIFLACKDNVKLVGDLAKACFTDTPPTAPPSCYENEKIIEGCEM